MENILIRSLIQFRRVDKDEQLSCEQKEVINDIIKHMINSISKYVSDNIIDFNRGKGISVTAHSKNGKELHVGGNVIELINHDYELFINLKNRDDEILEKIWDKFWKNLDKSMNDYVKKNNYSEENMKELVNKYQTYHTFGGELFRSEINVTKS